MVAPPPLAEDVLAALERKASVLNVVHLAGAARRPSGDLILCEVAREDASVVLSELRELGLAEQGTIAIETIDTAISTAARAAEDAAAGSPADAVVWEEVESRTSESAELSGSFLAFMVLATLIAGVGILTDSVILIIGAMVVGPEFGPLAGLCVALVHRRLTLARRSLTALVVGFPPRSSPPTSERCCSAPPTEARRAFKPSGHALHLQPRPLPPSSEPFALRRFRGPRDPRLPLLPASELNVRRGSSVRVRQRAKVPVNWHFSVVCLMNTQTQVGRRPTSSARATRQASLRAMGCA